MTREEVARHFRALTAVSREDIFGLDESTLRPINLPLDAKQMFAGYVGRDYSAGQGVLFLAINPGGGGDAYTRRTPDDEVLYPLIIAFNKADRDTTAAFERLNDGFARIVQRWNLWRNVFGPAVSAAGLKIEQVAFMNIVPYRTRQDKMPPAQARRIAWSRIIEPTLEILKPAALITVGKKAGGVVEGMCSTHSHFCVPRTIGDRRMSDGAPEVLAQIRGAMRRITMR